MQKNKGKSAAEELPPGSGQRDTCNAGRARRQGRFAAFVLLSLEAFGDYDAGEFEIKE
jgi:hypothetical protein